MLFESGHLAKVTGLELADGRRVVVKVRPFDGRAADIAAVQRRLFDHGFPCPQLLAGPDESGEALVTAEALVVAEPVQGPPAGAECAALLAELVANAGDPFSVPTLWTPLPWVGWDHDQNGHWPVPDDLNVDLNATTGPRWLDDACGRVRRRLALDDTIPVIGHCDWEAHNLGWRNGSVSVVFDWDSLGVRREAVIAGAAAAVFPARADGTVAAHVEQSAAFLDEYRRHRPGWTNAADESAWAAGLWVLLFNARKQVAGGGIGYLEHLERELHIRSRLAGIE
ncbi:MAG: aminoglycoside phosphotransferase/kinase family protein [Acidimicrobiales bacterium]